MKKSLVSAAVASIWLATASEAALIAELAGIEGFGFTTLSLRGEAIADGAGVFGDGIPGIQNLFLGLSDFTDAASLNVIAPVFGAAEINVGLGALTETRGVDGFFADSGLSDSFGLSVMGPGGFAFADGDLVAWSGELTFAQDITSIANFSGTQSFVGTDFGGSALLDFELIVNAKTAAVPLPATLTMGLTGLLALGAIGAGRRRRKA